MQGENAEMRQLRSLTSHYTLIAESLHGPELFNPAWLPRLFTSAEPTT